MNLNGEVVLSFCCHVLMYAVCLQREAPQPNLHSVPSDNSLYTLLENMVNMSYRLFLCRAVNGV